MDEWNREHGHSNLFVFSNLSLVYMFPNKIYSQTKTDRLVQNGSLSLLLKRVIVDFED